MNELAKAQANFEAEHRAKGWFTAVYVEKPDEVSPSHRHGQAHILILEGSTEFILDNTDKKILKPGDEISIADNQLHAVVSGPQGFSYVFACPLEEAQRQHLID